MKILIIGTGFLGTRLTHLLSKNNEVIAADINPTTSNISKLDATNKQEVEEFLKKEKPQIVIDTVALTSSLACEKDPPLAEKLNYLTAKNIAEACNLIKANMIFISSSYIFDGENGNYSEEDKFNPVNTYAQTKILAEKEVSKIKDFLILRVDIMYGYTGLKGKNGVFDKILSNQDIQISDPNQIRQPLFVDDLAKVIMDLVSKKQIGIFHVAGPDRLSMIDFLQKLEKIIRKDSKIGITKDASMAVKHPHNTTLNISKIKSLGIKTTSFEQALKIIKTQINSQQS